MHTPTGMPSRGSSHPSSIVRLETSQVREDARQGTHIQGAVDLAVTSELEIMEHMQRGSMYRTTEATNCNEVSSRSHAVLQLTVKAVHRFGEGGGKKKRLSKLSMIDLAGPSAQARDDAKSWTNGVRLSNTGNRLVGEACMLLPSVGGLVGDQACVGCVSCTRPLTR